MSHFKRLGKQIRFTIPTDEDGFVGRECPNPDCLGYFKIKFGTGLKGKNLPCHCPYCGHTDGHDKFWTKEQIEYTRSVVFNKVSRAFQQEIKDWDRRLRQQSRKSFIKFSVKFKGRPQPIHYYEEKELETKVVCDHCTLHYVIYGVFGYCPDCGTHNSLQILNKNLELAEKEIALAKTAEDQDLAEYLSGDALENAVSTFDGFGREICRVYSVSSPEPEQAQNISFQNLTRAGERVQTLFGFDLAGSLAPDEWESVARSFQKRHVLAHKMGVIDEAYVAQANDLQAIVGRKVIINVDEVTDLINRLKIIGNYLSAQLQNFREDTNQ